MNKLKLIQIITKDLEELRTLIEEIAENQDDSSLITDLALSRARLLSQEIELLREYSVHPDHVQTEEDDEIFNDEEDEISGQSISEPELEILHFEEQESPEEVEPVEEEEDQVVYDSQEAEEDDDVEEELDTVENPEEKDLTGEDIEEDEPEEVVNQESDEDELEEHELVVHDEEEIDFEDEDEDEIEDKEEYLAEEEQQTEENIQPGETKAVHQPEVREISMDELDEGEEPMQFAALSDSGSRPVMREIPKPEELIQDEKPDSETFEKERSLNDVIGEKKTEETVLGTGPITSLRSAIGLNDRFLFIREIFGNNTDKFNSVIEQLDKLETIQQAVDYLRVNLTLEKNETSLRFVDLLKRRFIK